MRLAIMAQGNLPAEGLLDDAPLRQRLATILAADVAGYSRLMQSDERATIAALDAARAVFARIVAANQGRVIDMAGDSVLAVFDTAIGVGRRARGPAHARGGRRRARGPPHALSHRRAPRRRHREGRRQRLRRRRQHRRAARGAGRARRDRRLGADAVGGARQARRDVRRFGRAPVKNIAEPVRAFRVHPSRSPEPSREACGEPAPSSPLASRCRQAVDRGAAVRQHERRRRSRSSSPTASPRTSSPSCRASASCSSSRATRPSSFKGQAVDVKEVGRRLGVRYVVEGSVRKAGQRVRITVQLIDAATDRHVWAERFDRELEDIFADPGRGHDGDRRDAAGPRRGGRARPRWRA